MRITIKSISALICFVVLLVLPFVFKLYELLYKNFFLGLAFWCIGIIAMASIFYEYKKARLYSITMLSHFFIYTFVFIAGGYQYLMNKLAYNNFATDEDIIMANLIIILWQIIAMITVGVAKKNTKYNMFEYSFDYYVSSFSKTILIGICFVVGFVFLLRNGIQSLFNRYYYNELFSTGSQALTSLLKILKCALGTWTLYLCAIDYKNKNATFRYVIFALLACLLVVPPFATNRTFVLITYGGFLMIMTKRLKKGMNFMLLIIFLDLFAAPFFNLFRAGFSGDGEVLVNAVSDFKKNFLMSDYDAYSMFLFSIKYVKTSGVTFGKQLLSVFLFFIPRSIWPDKPEGTGATVMDSIKSANVSNISCPIFGEAYVNFGIIGIILFSILVSWIMIKLDCAYWNSGNIGNSMIKNVYPFLVLFILIVFRGDLLNAYSWLIGYIVVLVLLRIVFIKRKDKTPNNR